VYTPFTSTLKTEAVEFSMNLQCYKKKLWLSSCKETLVTETFTDDTPTSGSPDSHPILDVQV
jgi:hypothetical protein